MKKAQETFCLMSCDIFLITNLITSEEKMNDL